MAESSYEKKKKKTLNLKTERRPPSLCQQLQLQAGRYY